MFQPGYEAYTQGFGSAPAGPNFPVYLTAAPTSTTTQGPFGTFQTGQIAIVPNSGMYGLLGYTSTAGTLTANWVQFANSTGAILTITGDTGGAESPLAGNFNLKGTANQIAVTGSANTETFSLIGPYTPATYTAHGVLIGEGTSSIVATAAGTDGQVLTGNTGADPAFAAIGTKSGLTAHGVLIGEGTSAFAATAAGTTGQVLIGATGADPAFGALGVNSGLTVHGVLLGENNSAIAATTAGTNGQVFLGSTAADPAFGTLTTSTGVNYTTGAASLAIDLKQGGYKINAASTGVSLVAQNSYTVTQAAQTSFALPATAAVGDMFLIASGLGNTSGWIITQGASQEIWANTNHTTNGATGTLAGAIHCSVVIMCTIANTEFIVVGGSGLTGLTFT